MRSHDHRPGGRPWARPFALAIAIVGPLAGGVSLAAPDTKIDQATHDRAQKAYQEALKLYKGGQYRAAIDKLIEARKLDPTSKELPYNLGMVYEKTGDLDNAIKNFELFLALETDPEEKDRVRSIVQRLEGARAELAKSKPSASAAPPPPPVAASSSAPPAPTPTDEPPPPVVRKGRLDGAVYATGGLAAAAALAGAALGVRALLIKPKAETGLSQSYADYEDKTKKAHQSAVFADIGFGVAVAAGGAAALLYFLRDAPPAASDTSSAFVSPVRGGAMAGWGVRF